jgi:hypothetical protein
MAFNVAPFGRKHFSTPPLGALSAPPEGGFQPVSLVRIDAPRSCINDAVCHDPAFASATTGPADRRLTG